MQNKWLHIIKKRYASKWLVLLFDVTIVIATLFLAYLIRFNFKIDFDIFSVIRQLPIVVIAAIISFLSVKSHKGVVRYTGLRDVVNIVIGANILATILLITTYASRKFGFAENYAFSGSVIYIHLLLNILFLIGSRFFIKSLYRSIISDFHSEGKVLIYGAGNSGMITYDAIHGDSNNNLEIIGFIDDNDKKIGKKINLLNVYGLDQITEEFISKNELTEVIISIQNMDIFNLSNT